MLRKQYTDMHKTFRDFYKEIAHGATSLSFSHSLYLPRKIEEGGNLK